MDDPFFPPPPGPRDRTSTGPYRAPSPAPPMPEQPSVRRAEPPVEPVDEALPPSAAAAPSRRLGCVIPLAVVGILLVAAGVAFLGEGWSGGPFPVRLVLSTLAGGIALLWFARAVYRDPNL